MPSWRQRWRQSARPSHLIAVDLDHACAIVGAVVGALGKWTDDMARRFMVDLAGRLVLGSASGYPAVQLSTDGFKPYAEAVDLAFAGKVLYRQIIKEYCNANRPYTPSEIIGSRRKMSTDRRTRTSAAYARATSKGRI